MKLLAQALFVIATAVASLAEAWIETILLITRRTRRGVASLAEAWIETFEYSYYNPSLGVASLAEAWIETNYERQHCNNLSRLPRGGVD